MLGLSKNAVMDATHFSIFTNKYLEKLKILTEYRFLNFHFQPPKLVVNTTLLHAQVLTSTTTSPEQAHLLRYSPQLV